MTNIMEHVKFLSSEPRFTGYPGFFKAAEYIASKFREYGLQPYGENGTYFSASMDGSASYWPAF
jgi:hypothetical protein